jgi:hypothetical protein
MIFYQNRHFSSTRPEMAGAFLAHAIQYWAMLTNPYVDAIIADPDLADQVWELWYAGEITDDLASWAWWIIAGVVQFRS